MKLKQTIFLSVILLLAASLQTFSQQKVYYVGHSLVNINIPYQVWKIQDKASIPNYFMHHINIGASLKTNWQDTSWNPHPVWDFSLGRNIDRGTNHFRQLITPYDYLVMTEAVPLRNYPTDTVVKYLTNFINLAKTGNTNIKKFLYATWEGNVRTDTNWRPQLDSLKPIWENLADQSALQTGGDTVFIIPGNIAMMYLYDELQAGPIGSYTAISQFFEADGIHLSHEGNYLIACLMSAVVYHTNPIGQDIIQAGSYTSDSCIVDSMARKRIQEIAMEVACNYPRTGYKGAYCNTSSINEKAKIEPLVSLFPNPTQNVFSIKTNGIIKQIKVITLTGKTIYELNKNSNKIDITNYPKGIYFVQIKFENSTLTKKIILN
jgi:hypothetical protein